MNPQIVGDVREWLVRDLVEYYPQTMALLVPYGIDLCCGGSREVGEALSLHGAPVEEVLAAIEAEMAFPRQASAL